MNDTVLVSGYSKAPSGTPMHVRNEYAGAVLEIDTRTHRIVAAEFTFVTELARRFFEQMVVGYCLPDELDKIIGEIEKRYWAPSDRALVMALRAASQRYVERATALGLI